MQNNTHGANNKMRRSQKNKNGKKKKKKSIGFKIGISFLLIFLVALICGVGYFFGMFYKMKTIKIDSSDLSINHDEIKQYDNADKITNIALFGVDQSNGEAGRSDSIMIATIDPVHNKLKITSIMRDSYVNIPGHGMDKLNHAYAFGGPQLAIKTINENFGLNIKDFATVDFSSLPIIINILGGVTINIDPSELNDINKIISGMPGVPRISGSGPQYLSGEQALAYTRNRTTAGGDYKRTERQRIVLDAIFKEVSAMSTTTYNSLLNSLLPYVETSLSPTNILSLGTSVLGVGNGTLVQDRFPRDGYAEGKTINGVYYLTFDIDTTKIQMREYIFNDKLPN